MSDIQAAIGLAQLQDLQHRVDKKRVIFEKYAQAFEGLKTQSETSGAQSNRWLSAFVFENPLLTMNSLASYDIETRLSWKPMHLQPIFKDAISYLDGTSEYLFKSVLCLPSGVGLTEQQQDYVIDHLKKAT